MHIGLGGEDDQEIHFLGLNFSDRGFDDAVEEVFRSAHEQSFSYIVTPNVDHIVRLFPRRLGPHTRMFLEAYESASLRLCDSRILQRLGRIAGVRLQLVPGSDLTAMLFARVLGKEHRVAIVGGGAQTVAALEAKFPGPEYVQHVPPMGVLYNSSAMQEVVKFVVETRPNVTLFVFGSPQSEIAALECSKAGAKGVGLCVGASIDFLIGTQKRAPTWMQRAGLEWLHRLASDPARLWRRYLLEGPRIFWLFAVHRRCSSLRSRAQPKT